MNMKTWFQQLIRYMAWADRRTLESLGACAAAQGDGLPLAGHLVAAEHVWLCRVEGREAKVGVWPELTLAECEVLATENAAGYAALVDRQDDAGWSKPIQYRNMAGQEWITPLGDILTHVVTHGTYHRGQIARIIGRAGGTSANTDFIIFTREEAATR